MYTEENEFNYDDYLDEEDNNNSNKPFIDFKFLLKLILIIILICLIIFLVFKIRNKNLKGNKSKEDTEINEQSGLAVVDNINLIRNAAYDYFFKNNHLPENVGETKSITIKELNSEGVLINVKDENGVKCGYNTSSAKITKHVQDYELKITLNCLTSSDEKVFYYDLNGNCLTCNGENYTPSEENNTENNNQTNNNENNNQTNNNTNNNQTNNNENNDQTNNNENNNQTNNNTNNDQTNTQYVCDNTFGEWTRVRNTSTNLIEESRILVKGYKTETVYGEWSSPTTKKIQSNSNLDVKKYTKTTKKTSKSCSDESTTKPASKTGRTNTSRTVTNKSTKKVCTGGKTYTKKLTKWDNNAISCKSYGIGNVVCTYKTKKTCTNKTIYNKVTYYKYCDTKTKNITTTYYQSRSIDTNVTYTDYMLESELPEGYIKLDGSEITEYRYKEKCGK